ncbi:MAG: glycosyl transferase family 2 [Bacteroidota bacterium]|jgi:cellulose synthase/poly-beta-1,6-N-acetylglucosamine synthase-like glycosyltransferase|nr:glycosyl transferase family 2 [Bacteroidota bacterium]
MYFPDFVEIGADELLLVAFFVSLLGILIHYLTNVLPLGVLKTISLEASTKPEPVSVIICARNEDDNLAEFLPKILVQDYPEFEVVVVNDCSIDNTENVIDEFAKIFPNLKKVTIKEDDYYKHGKKLAVVIGIKGAKHDNLLFTDADCYPANDQWLRDMSAGFVNRREIVLGYGAYKKEKGFLNKLIRFDTFLIAANYLSAAIKGKPYMGVGRNLAYTKKLFYKQKGFSTHYHILSGDDDLFVNQACSDENTNVAVSHNAITYSIAKSSFTDWKRQKQRHLTTAPYYSSGSKTRIMTGYILQYTFHLSFLSVLLYKTTLISALVGFILKICFQMIIFKKASKKLNESDLWAWSFFYEIILLVVYPVIHISKLFHKPNKWKS